MASLENTIYSPEAKRELGECLEKEASAMIGDQMIYNLVEWLREHLMHYVDLSKQDLRQVCPFPTSVTWTEPLGQGALNPSEKASSTHHSKQELPKKEKMTKAQKRRYYTRSAIPPPIFSVQSGTTL